MSFEFVGQSVTLSHFQKKLVPSLLMPVDSCLFSCVCECTIVGTDAPSTPPHHLQGEVAVETFSACDNLLEVDAADPVSRI